MDETTSSGAVVSIASFKGNDLAAELQWLSKWIEMRLKIYFKHDEPGLDLSRVKAPELDKNTTYGKLVAEHELSEQERLVFALAITPHIQPHLLDNFFIKNANHDKPFTEFGGRLSKSQGFVPTVETAKFLLAGDDIPQRLNDYGIFSREHKFHTEQLISTENLDPYEPDGSRILTVNKQTLQFIISGEKHKPDYSMNLPARLTTTRLAWDDLILDGHVMEEIEEIISWIRFKDRLLNEWKLGKQLKPGYKSLFYGAPGTGKTLTAALLGKRSDMDVYRIDLSMVISKYIGETEKNLANVFDQAENKNWILFFDEADALFSKRTTTNTSNDRYANQEVAYLLQRIEDFPGLVILATNLRANLDSAFARRFQSVIHFPVPGAELRAKLWRSIFSEKSKLNASINIEKISNDYELTGGAIVNVVRYCSLKALERNSNEIIPEDIYAGIRKEFRKEGKTV